MSSHQKALSGHLILLMAPSGSGKSLLLKHIRQEMPDIYLAVSCTTRQSRPGETEGETYYFIDLQEFKRRIKNEDFLEWAEYGNNLYGTLKSEIIKPMEEGKMVLREVELQGINSILNIIPKENLTIIYIDGGDWNTLKKRIQKRAPISESELNLRHERYIKETAAKSLADIVIKNNEGRLREAKAELVAIIEKIVSNKIPNHES